MKLIKAIFLTGFLGNILTSILLGILYLIYSDLIKYEHFILFAGVFVINLTLGIQVLFIYVPLYFISKPSIVTQTQEEVYKTYLPYSFIPIVIFNMMFAILDTDL